MAQSVLKSMLETCRRRASPTLHQLSQTLRAFGDRLLPRPVLLAGR